MVSHRRQVLLVGLWIAVLGFAVGGYFHNRIINLRFQIAEDGRQQLEQDIVAIRVDHERAQQLLEQTRVQTQQLTETLSERDAQIEEATVRLAEEARTIRELESRLAAKEIRIGRLQGELVLALQDFDGDRSVRSDTVQLERVLISGGSEPAGSRGRVVSIDEDWSFVVINLGWDTVKIGDTVSIFRHDELQARARVERILEGVAAATILPDWENVQIEINDIVRLL